MRADNSLAPLSASAKYIGILCITGLCCCSLLFGCNSSSGSDASGSLSPIPYDNSHTNTSDLSYTADDCLVTSQNEFVYRLMTDAYFWHDRVPLVDPFFYSTPEALLEDVMYKDLDKWSYIISHETYSSYYNEAEYVGLGFGSKYDRNDDVRISFVYEDSPAGAEGVKRGDKIIKINDLTVKEIEDHNLWGTVFGPQETGIIVTLEIETSEGVIRQISLAKGRVKINTVLHSEIFEVNNMKTGYLVFKSFLPASIDELDAAFQYFSEESVEELILDLRYNSGGRLSVAQHLSSLIIGNDFEDDIFQKLIHNDNYRDWDVIVDFTDTEYALNLDRVIVITTASTCSASETIINGLEPYVSVVTIGDTTCGKPVGMYGYSFCDKRIMPIQFELTNARDDGRYFDGIPATCYAEDDLFNEFGDTEEGSLQQALNYISSGFCDISASIMHDSTKTKELELHGFMKETGSF